MTEFYKLMGQLVTKGNIIMLSTEDNSEADNFGRARTDYFRVN